MNRVNINQYLIDKYDYRNYLEIGTFKGESFLPIRCRRKIAVDPVFKISFIKRIKWFLRNPDNIRNRFFKMSSDQFFKEKKAFLEKNGKLDLVFIDGQHTFRASLKDVLNSFVHLHTQGVIVLHDCFPPNEIAATPADSFEHAERMGLEGWKEEWCGDVWKTIVYLREQYKEELEVFVINTDYGLGIIKPISKESLFLSINENLYNEINTLDYKYLNSNPKDTLGLKEINTVTNFF